MTAPERGTFGAVLAELAGEHAVAEERHGFTHKHDDQHGDTDWTWRLLRRLSELMVPPTVLVVTEAERRRALLELAHIAASAVAAHDRRVGGDLDAAGDATEAIAAVVAADVDGLVVADGGGFRFVARPGVAGVERHVADCAVYNREVDPCTGCAPKPRSTD